MVVLHRSTIFSKGGLFRVNIPGTSYHLMEVFCSDATKAVLARGQCQSHAGASWKYLESPLGPVCHVFFFKSCL